MKNGTADLSRGLRFVLAGVGANLLGTFLPQGVNLAAAGVGFTLTGLGLIFATRADKRFWISFFLVVTNTILVDMLYDFRSGGPSTVLVGVLDLLLSTATVCTICLFTLPFVEGKKDGGAKQGQWAWKCEIASAVCALSVSLMKDVPGMEELKFSLSLLSSLAMLLTGVFYLYFLWKAGRALKLPG